MACDDPKDTTPQQLVMGCLIWYIFPKSNPDHSTQKHLTDIRVDINDAWLAAVALTHNLILVTDDNISVIRACVPELRVENWLV